MVDFQEMGDRTAFAEVIISAKEPNMCVAATIGIRDQLVPTREV